MDLVYHLQLMQKNQNRDDDVQRANYQEMIFCKLQLYKQSTLTSFDNFLYLANPPHMMQTLFTLSF